MIVFNDGERRIGILVDQILDIAEDTITVRQSGERKGLLGSAVIGEKVTDLVDLRAVIETAREDWFSTQVRDSAQGATIMVAEGSAFSRGLVRNALEAAGYRVVEAANNAEALRELEQRKVDAVVTALDLPGGGAYNLVAQMRAVRDLAGIPVLALANSAEEAGARGKREPGFEDCQLKFDHDAMMRSVARLAAAVRAAEPAPVMYGGKE